MRKSETERKRRVNVTNKNYLGQSSAGLFRRNRRSDELTRRIVVSRVRPQLYHVGSGPHSDHGGALVSLCPPPVTEATVPKRL